jgi:hypothetical protein
MPISDIRYQPEMNQEYKNYISLHEAAKHCSYSQEYLALRIRQGKLIGKKLGRNWVTRKEWLDDYSKQNGKGLSGSFNNFFPDFRDNFISTKKTFLNTEKFSIIVEPILEVVVSEKKLEEKKDGKFLPVVLAAAFSLFSLVAIFIFTSSPKYSQESRLAKVSVHSVLQPATDFFTIYGRWLGDGIKNKVGKIKTQFSLFPAPDKNSSTTETAVENKYEKEGLAVKWKFDEGLGATAYDASSNHNNGTLYGGMATSVTSGWRAGGYGGALAFDGGDDYIGVENSDSLALRSAITVEAWINASSFSGHASNQYRILDKFIYLNDGWYLYYYSATTGISRFVFATYDGTSHPAIYNIVPTLNTWYFIVGVSDGTNNRIYVNGVSGSPAFSGTLTSSTNPLRIGGYGISDYAWSGLIDDISIYNYARTPDQIRQDYNAGFSAYFR